VAVIETEAAAVVVTAAVRTAEVMAVVGAADADIAGASGSRSQDYCQCHRCSRRASHSGSSSHHSSNRSRGSKCRHEP
jgi:hypothetical protein